MDDPIPIGHGLEHEPHLRRAGRARADPTESAALETLAAERRARGGEDPGGHEAFQSVREEVHATVSARHPTREGWGDWYIGLRAGTSAGASWLAVLAIACVSGPLALPGALLVSGREALSLVVFGPTLEEVLKIGLIAIVVETRPYLVKSGAQIRLVALLSAAVFAAVENVLYVFVYLDAPSPGLIAWRWTVCVALHVVATSIAAEGLVRVWRWTDETFQRPSLDRAYGWLFAAVAVHGGYNLAAVVLDSSGYAY